MSTSVKPTPGALRLERVLLALESDLLEASDEEVLEAAADLGIEPHLQGSSAFIGILSPARMRPDEFFDLGEPWRK